MVPPPPPTPDLPREGDGWGRVPDDFAGIRVWLADLDGPGPWPDAARTLTPAEHDRADRFHFDEDRERWVRGRALTRHLLARTLGVDPATLPWREADGGKPWIDHPDAPAFNVSHSGPILAVALSRSGPVGIDVEVLRPLRDLAAVAREVFRPREWAVAEAMGEADRLRAFYRMWTAKEAVLKYLGTGLSLPPRAILLSGDPTHPRGVRAVDHEGWRPGTARLVALPVEGGVGASGEAAGVLVAPGREGSSPLRIVTWGTAIR